MSTRGILGTAVAKTRAGREGGEVRPAFAGHPDVLASIQAINRDFLRIIAAAEFAHTWQGQRFLGALSATIAGADADALAHALRFPFLFVDLGFSATEHWDSVGARHPIHDGDDVPARLQELLLPVVRSAVGLALHLARADRDAALVLMGLSPEVADLLVARGFHELDTLTWIGMGVVRPRWHGLPVIWHQVFTTDNAMPVECIRDFVLHALQLSVTPQLQSAHSKPLPRHTPLR
jgi:hypothetical protein